MTMETQGIRHDMWQSDDTVDLGKFLDTIIAWWREIALITGSCIILVTIGIFTMRAILPPQFHASANVAIVRTISNVNFDERFQTTSEEIGTNTANLSARRSALLGLVRSGSIAREIIAQLGNELTKEEQIPSNLLEMVEGEEVGDAQGGSDLIRITITANDPDKAALIATTWAQTFVRQINMIYGQVPNEVASSIEEELAKAKETYLKNQANLEAFIAQNRIDELTNVATILQQRITQEVSLQQAYLKQWQLTQEQLTAVYALKEQIEQGGAGAARSTIAALQVLKMSVYTQPPAGLQVEVRDIPEVTSAMLEADLEGLIASLEGQLQNLATKIAADDHGLTAISQTNNSEVAETLQALRIAKSQLEAETAQHLQLLQQRDLSWETYKTLSSKQAELGLTRAVASSEVRFGSEAVTPTSFQPRIPLLIGIIIAGIIGIIIALLTVSLAAYLNYTPFFRHSYLAKPTPE